MEVIIDSVIYIIVGILLSRLARLIGTRMNKKIKIIIIFLLIFILSFLFVGYIKNTFFVAIDWVERVTIWDKFKEYYIRTFYSNVIPSFIISIIFVIIIWFTNSKRN